MASNLQNKPTATFQAISYQGSVPPLEMMERFKKLDTNLPERIVRMAEMSLEKSFKELEIYKETALLDLENKKLDLENQKADLNIKQHEAETKRIVVEKGSKYDFRAQIIILVMVIIVLGAAVLLGVFGLSNIAYLVVAGGFKQQNKAVKHQVCPYRGYGFTFCHEMGNIGNKYARRLDKAFVEGQF